VFSVQRTWFLGFAQFYLLYNMYPVSKISRSLKAEGIRWLLCFIISDGGYWSSGKNFFLIGERDFLRYILIIVAQVFFSIHIQIMVKFFYQFILVKNRKLYIPICLNCFLYIFWKYCCHICFKCVMFYLIILYCGILWLRKYLFEICVYIWTC